VADTSPRYSVHPAHILPEDHVLLTFKSEVDASLEMAVDGSTTPVRFAAVIPDMNDRAYMLQSIVIMMLDAVIEPTAFGGIAGGITNGITLTVEPVGGGVLNLLPEPATANWMIGIATPRGTGGVTRIQGAATDDVISFVFEYDLAGFICLMRAGDKLVVTVSDDLTPLTAFRGAGHGYFRG
jgi:hypothetical protein